MTRSRSRIGATRGHRARRTRRDGGRRRCPRWAPAVRTASRSARTAGAARTLSDVLVGDVFLCSGQSNMEFGGRPVPRRRGRGRRARRTTGSDCSPSRTRGRLSPPATFEQAAPAWQSAGPDSLRRFSAVCYYFGREVHETQNVPVGLVNAVVGRIGDRAVDWRGRPAGGRRLRRPSRHAAGRSRVTRTPPTRATGGCGRTGGGSHGASAGEPWNARGLGAVDRRPRPAELEDVGRAGAGERTTAWCGTAASFTLTAAQAAQGRARCRSAGSTRWTRPG